MSTKPIKHNELSCNISIYDIFQGVGFYGGNRNQFEGSGCTNGNP
jgi:hypothetical protein